MSPNKFVYVTYIRTTPEKLWDAFTNPEFTRQYWYGVTMDCKWEKGASWKMMIPDGREGDTGEILEIEHPKRMVIRWRNEFRPELKAEGYSRCTVELEQMGEVVKMTIIHEMEKDGPSKFIEAVSGGWPKLMASLKTLLETGEALPDGSQWPKSAG